MVDWKISASLLFVCSLFPDNHRCPSPGSSLHTAVNLEGGAGRDVEETYHRLDSLTADDGVAGGYQSEDGQSTKGACKLWTGFMEGRADRPEISLLLPAIPWRLRTVHLQVREPMLDILSKISNCTTGCKKADWRSRIHSWNGNH
ncbi:hypothetical protein PGTUg99_035094 [Puccinia graminis f. sp. tritici]|uniref:Uncharacterized protein n=1 Tax=Puccinia graminis f. sp. tritici TaxID=56615 RepID=A0A5B0S1B7_PUCGR|nr:hypothetical protein PGTUg99_035094 [Puccinia graminis f. sp. tritici]